MAKPSGARCWSPKSGSAIMKTGAQGAKGDQVWPREKQIGDHVGQGGDDDEKELVWGHALFL